MGGEIANQKIIVGLGNPGEEYKKTYHNIGFLFLDSIAGGETKWRNITLFAYTKKEGIILVKNNTFMNECGIAVSKALSFFNVDPSEMIVAHDDADIPLGSYKIQRGRGAAGHRGVASVIAALHTKNFTRIRIGIGKPKELIRKKAGDFVLEKIGKEEWKIFQDTFHEIALHIKGE